MAYTLNQHKSLLFYCWQGTCQIKAVHSPTLSFCSIFSPLKEWYCTLESCRANACVLLLQHTYFLLHPSQISHIVSIYLGQKYHHNVKGKCGSSTEMEEPISLPYWHLGWEMAKGRGQCLDGAYAAEITSLCFHKHKATSQQNKIKAPLPQAPALQRCSSCLEDF